MIKRTSARVTCAAYPQAPETKSLALLEARLKFRRALEALEQKELRIEALESESEVSP
jgi:hypothetical protein